MTTTENRTTTTASSVRRTAYTGAEGVERRHTARVQREGGAGPRKTTWHDAAAREYTYGIYYVKPQQEGDCPSEEREATRTK